VGAFKRRLKPPSKPATKATKIAPAANSGRDFRKLTIVFIVDIFGNKVFRNFAATFQAFLRVWVVKTLFPRVDRAATTADRRLHAQNQHPRGGRSRRWPRRRHQPAGASEYISHCAASFGQRGATRTRHTAALEFEIADNGRGFAPAQRLAMERAGHRGLLTIEERAKALGGHATVTAAVGEGVRIAGHVCL
jgi:hypothetical protein